MLTIDPKSAALNTTGIPTRVNLNEHTGDYLIGTLDKSHEVMETAPNLTPANDVETVKELVSIRFKDFDEKSGFEFLLKNVFFVCLPDKAYLVPQDILSALNQFELHYDVL